MSRGTTPLSVLWGTDRGQPIHRLYVDRFLSEFRADIRGSCLEFQDPMYVTRYGGSAVTSIDILHVDDSNPRATLIADITRPNNLPSNAFDCIVCTHVLHVIYDVRAAVSELYRILKPGGVLLVAVPHVSMVDPELFTEYWRFTPDGLAALLGERFGAPAVTIRAYGNSLATAGDLRGLVSHEFTSDELNVNDQRFALEVGGRAVKA